MLLIMLGRAPELTAHFLVARRSMPIYEASGCSLVLACGSLVKRYLSVHHKDVGARSVVI